MIRRRFLSGRNYFPKFLFVAILFFNGSRGFSQTPGFIIEPSAGSVLDPNKDGYITRDGQSFSLDGNDTDEFEGSGWWNLPVLGEGEIIRDVRSGQKEGYTDFSADPMGHAAYLRVDETNIIFRIRLADYAPNSIGYTILLDTDGFIGQEDNTFIPEGNPGFELAVLLKSKEGVYIVDFDASGDDGGCDAVKYSYPIEENHQKAIAGIDNGGDRDAFYDFYVPLEDIYGAGSISEITKLRWAVTSNTSNSCTFSGSVSDIAGLDDQEFPCTFCALEEIVRKQDPVSIAQLRTRDLFTPCPSVLNEVNAGNSVLVSGATIPGATVRIYVNKILEATAFADLVSGEYESELPILAPGDFLAVTAEDTKAGLRESNSDCNSRIISDGCDNNIRPTMIITDPPGNSAKLKGFSDFKFESTDDIEIQVRVKGTIILESGELVDFDQTDGSWEYTLTNEDGSDDFEPKEYEARIGGGLNCWSDWVTFCGESNAPLGVAPTVRIPAGPVVVGSTVTFSGLVNIINVKEVTGAVIFISQEGKILGSTEVDGNSNESDVFWTIQDVLIGSCGDVEIYSLPRFLEGISGCSTPPDEKTIIQVSQETSDPPEVTGTYCSPVEAIYGRSSESEGTTINVMVNGNTVGVTSVNENGNWSLKGLNLFSGSITASAQNTEKCETISSASNAVVISRSPVAPTITWPDTVSEGTTEISVEGGTGKQLLYIDGAPVTDADGNPISSETGTFSGLSAEGVPGSYIYAGGLLSVVQTEGPCLSPESNSIEVSCSSPDASLVISPRAVTKSSGSKVDVTISGSENFVYYQLYDTYSGANSGINRIGDGSDIILTSSEITANTILVVKATKIFAATCSTTLTGKIEVKIEGTEPSVAFSDIGSNGDESINSAGIQVYLSDTYAFDVMVGYTISGTATIGLDHTLTDGLLTIPAGSKGESIRIENINDDQLDEPDETAIITLSNPINAILGERIVHTYTILDDDNSPVLQVSDRTIAEGINYVLTASSTDADEGDSQTYSLSGKDGDQFNIDPLTGDLVFIVAPDFENPTDSDANNIYELDITVTDIGGNSDAQSIAVIITGINDNIPVLTVVDTAVSEGNNFVQTISVTDLDIFDTHTFSIGGTDGGLFAINQTTGDLFFIEAPDYENPIDENWDNIYNLEVIAIDGNGNRDRKSVEIQVLPINDESPELKLESSIFIAEGNANVVIALATDLDEDDTMFFSISGVDASFFNINSKTGVLTFKNVPDFENALDEGLDNTYDLIIEVADGVGNSDSQVIQVHVSPVNDNDPVINVDNVQLAEGLKLVQIVSVTDGDVGDNHTFEISGTDAKYFAIDSLTGELTFRAIPFFDNPQDSNGDNIYEIIVHVFDEARNTDSQSIQISIQPAPNSSPEAVNDEFIIDQGNSISGFNLLTNDTDPENDDLVINISPLANVDHGEVILNPDGTFVYIPDTDFYGTDSFSYEVCDARGACSIASVTIVVNEVNADYDNDGIPNDVEGTVDSDGDGIPDYEDTDSDNDGIPDEVEGIVDTDNDGVSDYLDDDSDDDTIPDSVEGFIDTDGDGILNFRDQDADNDGIPDHEELGSDQFADCDNDGIPNYLDKTRCGVVTSKGYSPNGDGENDFWVIEGIRSFPNNSVKIFNRWGNLIFHKEGYDNDQIVWTGQAEGVFVLGESEVPDGTYFYVIDLGDGASPVSGYIVLKR